MLKISKLTDYALLITSHMAKEPAAILSAHALAEVLHLMPPTVSKILKILCDGGVVKSLRGAEGGYLLAKQPSKISIADIISTMEGKLAITECCDSVSVCIVDSVCQLRTNWREINNFIYQFLAKLSLADLLQPLNLRELVNE
jgi:FeS assembly SUF system regulator